MNIAVFRQLMAEAATTLSGTTEDALDAYKVQSEKISEELQSKTETALRSYRARQEELTAELLGDPVPEEPMRSAREKGDL